MTDIDTTTTTGAGAAAVGVLGALAAWLRKSTNEKNQMAADLQECKGKITNMEGHLVELREQGVKHQSTLNALVTIMGKLEDNGAKLTALLEKDHEITAIHRDNMRDQLNRMESHIHQ